MPSLELRQIGVMPLDPVSLVLQPGERVTLSGPSGSGKTLLLRAVADLDRHGGEALLDGQACSTMSPSVWRRQVAYLPAEAHWWSDQVGDHLPSVDEKLLARLDFGPDVLSWTVARLSTGERQRLALIRLLEQRPGALLLDEPTANLDTRNRDRVEAVLDDYRTRYRAATLWVSHDPEQRRRLGGRGYRIRGRSLEPQT